MKETAESYFDGVCNVMSRLEHESLLPEGRSEGVQMQGAMKRWKLRSYEEQKIGVD